MSAKKSLKPGWSEEDEGYHYYITQSWEGIPIYNGAYVNQDEKTEAPMEIYQTREGIRYARMDRWFQIEPGDKSFRLAAFEDVMDTLEIVLEKRCSAEREGNPLTVEKAALYLFAVETDVEGLYDLEPVWVCTLAEERADLESAPIPADSACQSMPLRRKRWRRWKSKEPQSVCTYTIFFSPDIQKTGSDRPEISLLRTKYVQIVHIQN